MMPQILEDSMNAQLFTLLRISIVLILSISLMTIGCSPGYIDERVIPRDSTSIRDYLGKVEYNWITRGMTSVPTWMADSFTVNFNCGGYPSFFYATDTVTADELLKRGANLHTRGAGGDNVILHAANEHYSYDLVEWYLKHGVSPDVANSESVTPLLRAIELNEPYAVDCLLRNGANPNLYFPGKGFGHIWLHSIYVGIPPIIRAVEKGESEIVQLLLKHGAVVDTSEYKSEYTALIAASLQSTRVGIGASCLEEERIKILSTIFAHNPDLTKHDQGWIAICQAVNRCDLSMVQFLFERITNLSYLSRGRNLPWITALCKEDTKVFSFLLTRGWIQPPTRGAMLIETIPISVNSVDTSKPICKKICDIDSQGNPYYNAPGAKCVIDLSPGTHDVSLSYSSSTVFADAVVLSVNTKIGDIFVTQHKIQEDLEFPRMVVYSIQRVYEKEPSKEPPFEFRRKSKK
jgi:hypothetical protein